MTDEKKLLYVAGHNAVVYNTEEGSQQFIPGSENTECINYIAVSPGNPSSRFIALCERGKGENGTA